MGKGRNPSGTANERWKERWPGAATSLLSPEDLGAAVQLWSFKAGTSFKSFKRAKQATTKASAGRAASGFLAKSWAPGHSVTTSRYGTTPILPQSP